MLHLIPEPLHRLAYRLAHKLRIRWWGVRRPRLISCSVIALDADGRVLLVRHSYGSGRWMLPGGGVAQGEDPVAAAIRELGEETGCRLASPREMAVLEDRLHGAANVVHLVAGDTADTPKADRREIVEACFFAPDALPQDMPAALRLRLPEWLKAATVARPAAPPPPRPCPPPSPTG